MDHLVEAGAAVVVCDVDPRGRSINVSTGAMGTADPDLERGRCVRVELWPTGHEFLPGHRIRVQVAGAAHPLRARNLGTGEPLAIGTEMRPSSQQVFHSRIEVGGKRTSPFVLVSR